jgi:3,4-dihydroxy 2-butanone 4-phosphate synthase/GTP cyclohydrolase II
MENTQYGVQLDSLDKAVRAAQKGNPIILMDNPGREGEGDFIVPAAYVTPETMNFVLTEARGAFIAVFMPEDRAKYLGLPPQVDPSKNHESSKTNFRLTVDTTYGHSGCSAAERAQTANILGGVFKPYESSRFAYESGTNLEERAATPDDLVRPGHVIPIVGNPEGLKARQGHTESGIALMELAGIDPPVAIDMEILDPKDPHAMASPDYLRNLANRYDIPLISIAQICDAKGVEEMKYTP